jgi:hypothetical protein
MSRAHTVAAFTMKRMKENQNAARQEDEDGVSFREGQEYCSDSDSHSMQRIIALSPYDCAYA